MGSSAEEIIQRLTDADFLVEIKASRGHFNAFVYERYKRMEGSSAGADDLADALNLAAARWAGRQARCGGYGPCALPLGHSGDHALVGPAPACRSTEEDA